VLMKKGRPGHILSVLADPFWADELSRMIRTETGSLGVRAHRTERWAAARSLEEVEVAGLPVRIKVSPGRAKAESRDAVFVSRRTGIPMREVISLAEAAWRERVGTQSDLPTHPPPDNPTTA
jgi:pyridinium-3,5-bisthiocarboxylic acid mononucleotide nickel chelatase